MWVENYLKNALVEIHNVCMYEEDNTWIIYEKTSNTMLGLYYSKQKANQVFDLLKAFLSKNFSKLKQAGIEVTPINAIKIIKECTSWGTADCVDILKDNFIFTMPDDKPDTQIK